MKLTALVAIGLSLLSITGAFADDGVDGEPGDAMSFWDTQRKGANFFSRTPQPARFVQAREAGIEWARLTYDKWPTAERDFLMGNADRYDGLVEADLELLKTVLGWAGEAELGVVVTPLSLPGARWRQNNDNVFDERLWQDKAYWRQAADFWRDLARELKGNPAVVAYNIVNEPAPERSTDSEESPPPGEVSGFIDWYKEYAGTAHDLPAFYEQVVAAIRSVDPDTPIMVDSGWYGKAATFSYWPGALSDPKILYAFHMYDPWLFTSPGNFSKERGLVYPGDIPFGDATIAWHRETVNEVLQPAYGWAEQHGIPATRMVASEFGCMRRNEGCAQYLADVIANVNANDVHWAFYSFREDDYHGYDYELGTGKPGWKYWEDIEKGEIPVGSYKPNPLWEVIQSGLAD